MVMNSCRRGEPRVIDPAEVGRREAMALRGEFVAAFVEHVGPRPASERTAIKLTVLITVAAVFAVGAVVVGVFWHLIRPDKKAGAAAQTGPKVTYRAVAGWDCTAGNDHGFDVQGRSAAWRTELSGGWRDDGCHGSYESMPMSGRAADDPTQWAQWWFAPTSSGSCAVVVFIPEVPRDSVEAAATAAHYTVADESGVPYAEFTVDQTSQRGDWNTVGAFPIKNRKLVIRLTNRGIPKKPGDRLAVAQVQMQCTA
jgi:hypothetical protein